MAASEDLFQTLRGFRERPIPGKTPEQSFLEYCQNNLSGIERVHFDFKEKADSTDSMLGDSDKKNLSKAVSGFANGAGGVLIWGLENETLQPKPIHEVAAFTDRMLQLAHQVTDPAVPQIDGDFVPSDDRDGDGFALIFVPESQLPPHRVIINAADEKIKNHYFVRSGSSFTVATHSQLEDMFGRRPRPLLALNHVVERGSSGDRYVKVNVKLTLENRGRGIARYPFLAVEVSPPYGVSLFGLGGGQNFGLPLLGFVEPNEDRSDPIRGMQAKGGRYGSQEGLVIHSGMEVDVTTIKATILSQTYDQTSDLFFRFEFAAEGMAPERGETKIPAAELIRIAGF